MGSIAEEVGGSRTRRAWMGCAVGVALLVSVTVLLGVCRVIWGLLEVPTSSTGELVSQGQLLIALVSVILTAVLAACTTYYAWQSRALVVEARRSRQSQDAEAVRSRQAAEMWRLHGATAALHGAGLDLLRTATLFATDRRLRWMRRRSLGCGGGLRKRLRL